MARALIDVWDSNPRPLVMRQEMPGDSENGRGLLLVDAMCETWWWEAVPGWHGKRVRAVLKVPAITNPERKGAVMQQVRGRT